MTTENVVEVRGLRKSYKGVEAVRGIDFDIRRGETFALLGPNGAGKSTTIEILEGYRDRTGGEVSVLGIDPQHGGLAWKARLGIVLQSTGESGSATVREQLRHFAGLYPNPRDVEEVIAAVGLEEKANTRIGKLSGGQKRRVDVALGIVGRPELLFLDEPTTGLRPGGPPPVLGAHPRLSSEGTSILLTTHYLDEAAQLARPRAASSPAANWWPSARSTRLGGADARIPVVRWIEDGVLREERTTEPGQLVARLSAAGEPERLEVIRPSLEDIYLELVGETERASALPEGTLA